MPRSGQQTRVMHPAIARRLAVQRSGRDALPGGADPLETLISNIAGGSTQAQDRALRIIWEGECEESTAERLADAVSAQWMKQLPGGSVEAVVDSWEKLLGVKSCTPWRSARDAVISDVKTRAWTLTLELAQTPSPATCEDTAPVVMQDMFEPLADRITETVFDQLDAPEVIRGWFDRARLGTVIATGAIRRITWERFREAMDEVNFGQEPFGDMTEFVFSRPGAYLLAKNPYANRVENALKADLQPGVPTAGIAKAKLRQYYELVVAVRDGD